MIREKRYKRIVHEVEMDILAGRYKIGDKIPSINFWRIKTGLSRSSVMLAMEELKERGLVQSEQSVGYFVSSTKVENVYRFLLVFNEFNSFKQDLYNSIVSSLGRGAMVNVVFHNFKRGVFDLLLEREAGKYSVYLVMTGGFENVEKQLKKLGGLVILVDSCTPSLKGVFHSVTQDFFQDTYDALVSGLQQIRKYNEIVFVQNSPKEPESRYEGVRRFCEDYGFVCGFLKTMKDLPIRRGVVYLTPEEREIVNVELSARKQNYKAGEDYGLIAFNDQAMNEILCGGLTTISTDFVQMGKRVVDLVRERTIKTERNPSRLILRNTL
ncbi:MAG: GntR family transcriptional regulator [Bacteroidales bacterium]|nr:GntR family transcriptional regulator [Bacteroidales bacterium]